MDAPPSPPRRARVRDRGIEVDVVVIGAGRAGLTAAHHLRRARLVAAASPGADRFAGTFVVLDDGDGPGGSWRARWPGLAMAAAHRAHDLPGMPLAVPDADAPARVAVPAYFAQYEDAFALAVVRPVRATRVVRDRDRLVVTGRHLVGGEELVLRARAVINATGSWSRPFRPHYPGVEQFEGRQLHAHDYDGAAGYAGADVVVVGGGSSAVQIVADLAPAARPVWSTRRVPVIDGADRTPAVRAASAALVSRGPFERVGRRGLWFPPSVGPGSVGGSGGEGSRREGSDGTAGADGTAVGTGTATGVGTVGGRGLVGQRVVDGPGFVDGPAFVPADVIIWATGFRPAVGHLAPLRLGLGRADLDGPRVVAEPALWLVGSSSPGPADSRDARAAVRQVRALLEV